ncbi:hypothetical protein MFLAVUS_007328 [Mucor flavus]|uniref:NmrA-like domain-containing protein n=1 Tax=Mucor flavus TaxID=439312 RepID=A0ABP9Z434_9FUNG
MSQQTTSRNVCVITNVDSLLGYALAYRFLEAIRNNEDPTADSKRKIRILCRDTQGLELKRLEEMGAELMKVNYKEEEKLREAMKNVLAVVLIPENSSNRLKEAENLLKAAKHQDVKHVGLISFVGVDRIHKSGEEANSNEFRNLKEYHQIEKMVKESFSGNKHCIVRHQVFNQLYYFMAPRLEGQNQLPLPVKKDAKWGSVNMIDVVEAIHNLARKSHEQARNNTPDADAFYNKNIYELTMDRTMTAENMAHEIGQGLDREEMRFEEISGSDFRKYLESMKDDKRFKERPDAHGDPSEGRDGWWSIPIGKFLNDQNIETMIEFWRLACHNQQDVHSDDLRKLLERQPQNLKQYFKTNREQFRRFK